MSKEYVLVYAKNIINTDKVLLVLKDRPEELKGRLNLVGGKIELHESPEQAAEREFIEETGMFPHSQPQLLGKIIGDDYIIYCLSTSVNPSPIEPRVGETELVDWYYWNTVKYDSRLMPNLRLVIPLLHMEVENWEIKDVAFADNMVDVSFSIQIQ